MGRHGTASGALPLAPWLRRRTALNQLSHYVIRMWEGMARQGDPFPSHLGAVVALLVADDVLHHEGLLQHVSRIDQGLVLPEFGHPSHKTLDRTSHTICVRDRFQEMHSLLAHLGLFPSFRMQKHSPFAFQKSK